MARTRSSWTSTIFRSARTFASTSLKQFVHSDILLVIVGQRWLGAGRGGASRIDSETDFVRLEVETAMNNAVPIIPVLAGATRMPQPAQLPERILPSSMPHRSIPVAIFVSIWSV